MVLRLLLLIIVYVLPVVLHAADQRLAVTNFVKRLETAYNDKDNVALSKMIADEWTRERVIKGSARTKQKLAMSIREMKFRDNCVDVLIDMSDYRESHPVALQLVAEGDNLAVVKCSSPEADAFRKSQQAVASLAREFAASVNSAKTNEICRMIGVKQNDGDPLSEVLAKRSLSWIDEVNRKGWVVKLNRVTSRHDLSGMIMDVYEGGTIVDRKALEYRDGCIIDGEAFLGALSKAERSALMPDVDKLNERLAVNVSSRLIDAINSRDAKTVRESLGVDLWCDLDKVLLDRELQWIKEAMDGGVRINQLRMKIWRNAAGALIGSVPVPCAPGGTNIVRQVIFRDGKIDRAVQMEGSQKFSGTDPVEPFERIK